LQTSQTTTFFNAAAMKKPEARADKRNPNRNPKAAQDAPESAIDGAHRSSDGKRQDSRAGTKIDGKGSSAFLRSDRRDRNYDLENLQLRSGNGKTRKLLLNITNKPKRTFFSLLTIILIRRMSQRRNIRSIPRSMKDSDLY
jgi:hypothetical protein